MSHASFAVNAMKALRAQIEQQLDLNEDFRALKALDRALVELAVPMAASPALEAALATPALAVTPQAQVSLPRAATLPPPSVPHSALIQRLRGSFPRAASAETAKAARSPAA